MRQQISLGEIRRRSLRLLHYEDGLWDILLGSVFLMLSIYPITRRLLGPTWNLFLFLALLAILVASQLYARRVFSAPRIGVAKMRRTPTTTVMLVITVVLCLATLALVLATHFLSPALQEPRWGALPGWVSDLDVDIIISLVIVGIFSLMGYLFGVPRMYLYGWLVGAGTLASTALELYAGYSFNLPLAIAAGIIMLVGATLFVRFLRKYSIPTAQA